MRDLKSLAVLVLAGLMSAGLSLVWSQSDEEAAEAAVVAPIPASADAVKNPVERTQTSIFRGKQMFSSQCTMCHGHDGKGTGDLVERLQLPMPDFTDPAMQKSFSDGALFYALTEGHGRMPAQHDRFSDETKWDMVNYVRSLEKDK